MTFDKNSWDFDDPAGSAERFTTAQDGAAPAEALILQTQIARSFGLRRNFAAAQELLRSVETQRNAIGGEGAVRWWLEWGRTLASVAHRPDEISDADRASARQAYETAFETARDDGLDELAVDALHMLAITEVAPAGQVAVNRRALAFLQGSEDRGARSWEASIRNNIGMALHDAGDLAGALVEFEAALSVRQAARHAGNERVARWMVAWTLRLLGRLEEALAIQEALERDGDAAKDPDPYVFEELETIYTALGRAEDAARIRARREG